MGYKTIKTEVKNKNLGIVRLHRPDALNALNTTLMGEVVKAVKEFDGDENIGCIILTGSDKAFAAGADIKEMEKVEYPDAFAKNLFAEWDEFNRVRKPIVGGVAGYALGGGCELAMMCDFLIAGENAKFGQPEITLGVMPGMGGSQRMTRFVGKSKAMDLCLTGRMMDAQEAEKCGLVARVVPVEDLENTLLEVGDTIAQFSKPAVAMIKESVNRAFETPMNEGLMFERRLFHSLFATQDQKEGMRAFVEKRKAKFKDK